MAENRIPKPYLGICETEWGNYVVLFTDDDEGVIVQSSVTNKPHLQFGKYGGFDENSFRILSPDQQVTLRND